MYVDRTWGDDPQVDQQIIDDDELVVTGYWAIAKNREDISAPDLLTENHRGRTN